MNSERVQTTLRFVGDWPGWLGISAGLVLGTGAWLFYRREVRLSAPWVGLGLPALRAIVVFMLVLLLTGPVLHHRRVIGELTRLLLFVDGSRSMDLADPSMNVGRKVLILSRMGLLELGGLELPKAADALADGHAIVEKAGSQTALDDAALQSVTKDYLRVMTVARDRLAAVGDGQERAARFAKEVLDPAGEIAGRRFVQINDRIRTLGDLVKLEESTRRWQDELAAAFEKKAAEFAAGKSPEWQAAVAKFDAMPRSERVQAFLLEAAPTAMLSRLAKNFEVELFALEGGEARKLWESTAKNPTLPVGLPKAAGSLTDLSAGIKAHVGEQKEQRGAVVLFSDGQQNEGEPALEMAKVFGARQMPVYTVGLGNDNRPADLAVVSVDGPQATFYRDHFRGQITLKDDMPAGMAFKVGIIDGTKTLWETQLRSEGKSLRTVPFEFPVKDLVEARLAAGKQADVEVSGLMLELKVEVSLLEGDSEPANNRSVLRFRAITQKRKLLIVDGRPRWETRYLRNLFSRDEQWEVTTAIAGVKGAELTLARGTLPEEFPNSAGLLDSFDLIILGEVPRSLWQGEELQWINDFVGRRGGALIVIDGARGQLREYADTPLAPLFPVTWPATAGGIRDDQAKLSLSERGAALAPFTLAVAPVINSELWRQLPAPHWFSGATALPLAETFVEAQVQGQKIAGVVSRPFGAGKVLYQAFDESWRWRYEIGDPHHSRYWNQLVNWISEAPFAVRDKFVSLDAGASLYAPGQSAEIRVRLRNGDGKPVVDASVDAVLLRGGQKVATLRLAADTQSGGLFHGTTAALEPGEYEVRVDSAAIPAADLKAKTVFRVEAKDSGELTQLHLNEKLLRQIAVTSGGEYLREENAGKLVDLLAPLGQGKVIESETALWQSYWWFLPVLALLTIEWIIRKRVGLL